MVKKIKKSRDRQYEQKLVDIRRVARIVAGGKRFRFRATMVIGNRKGKVGFGIAKGADVTNAISKAIAQAEKNLIEVSIINDTISHEITQNFGSAKVFLKPASKGTGIIAGGPVRAVIDLAGIKNILSKMQGSSNKSNNVQATILALKELKSPEEIARRRGKSIEELGIRMIKDVSIGKQNTNKVKNVKNTNTETQKIQKTQNK